MSVKKKRTISAITASVAASLCLAVTAAAASFNFTLNIAEDDYTSPAIKTNSLQYASVDVNSGNFVSSDRLYLRVCTNVQGSDGNYNFATETKWVNAAPYSLTLNYTEATGTYGSKYRLRGYQGASASYGNLTASGTWAP